MSNNEGSVFVYEMKKYKNAISMTVINKRSTNMKNKIFN